MRECDREKSGASIGSLRCVVDQGAPPQFVEGQRRLDPARMIEVAVDQAVQEVADVEPAFSAGSVRISYDVDRAAVAQQVIEFGVVGELVDPIEIDEQQAPCVVGDALRR